MNETEKAESIKVRERDIWPPVLQPAYEVIIKTKRACYTVTANRDGIISVTPEIFFRLI